MLLAVTTAVTESDPPTTGGTAGPTGRLGAWAGPAIIGTTVVAAFVAGSNLWFFSDDWNIFAGWPSGRLLEPFNSHLSLVPIGVYQALFHTFGVESYVPFRVVGLVAYAALGWVTWRFAHERLGTIGATLATAAVLWNSGGVTNVMFPFLMNFSLPIAALAAIWWHLDRRTVRHDVTASLWLMLALATSGLGLMTAVAVGVELVWVAVSDRRVDWRRWLTLAPGPALWLVWYVAYGVDSPASGGLRPVVSYAVRMVWGGFGSLVGGNRWLGLVVAAAMALLIVAALVRRTFDGRIAAALAAPLAFAVLTAISRIGVVPAIPPDELRYQWTIGAFFVFTFVLLLAATADAPAAWRVSAVRPVIALTAIAVVANAVIVVGDVGDWNDGVETAVPGVRANLWVAEVAERSGTLERDRALPVSYVRVTAGEYVDAVMALGSPLAGFGADEFGGSADSRRAADEAFVADFDVAMTNGSNGPDDCERTFTGPGEVSVAAGTIAHVAARSASVDVGFAVFGSGVPLGTVYPDDVSAGVVATPDLPSGSPVPGYRLTLSAAAIVAVCDT